MSYFPRLTARLTSRLLSSTVRHASVPQAVLARPIVQRNPILHNVRLAAIHTTRINMNTMGKVAAKEDIAPAATPLESAPMRFEDLDTIEQRTQRALKKVFKYDAMSPVQEAVLTRLPETKDMFVKAKTGTGKTLAFLIAALETAVKSKGDMRYFDGTSVLVVSPTRELASQIAVEAEKLVRFYPCQVHCLVGGESKRKQLGQLERGRPDIIVATPGRLLDMMQSTPRMREILEGLKVVVLDEADQLVDMGFRADIERILRQVPRERQTMLFSATLSPEIRDSLGKVALRPDYELIDTVGKDDVHTHLNVKQSALIAPYDQQFAYLRNLLTSYPAAQTGKTIVFLPTTRSTMMYAQLLQYLAPQRVVLELHSKKSQDQRSRIAQKFRKSPPGTVLVTSDVSARGVDYPGVSLVLQIGVPSTREQYIHRLGRTGRAGKDGEGIIMLAPFESRFIKKDIGDLPVQNLVPPPIEEDEQQETEKLVNHVRDRVMYPNLIEETYTAYLGYYAMRMQDLGQRRSEALAQAEDFIRAIGIEEVPHTSPRFIQMLGLNDKGNGGFRERRGSSTGFRERRSNNGGGFRERYNNDGGFRERRGTNGGFRERRSSDGGFRERHNGDGGFRDRYNGDGGFRERRSSRHDSSFDSKERRRSSRRSFDRHDD